MEKCVVNKQKKTNKQKKKNRTTISDVIGVFFTTFEQVSHIFLVFRLFTLNKQLSAGYSRETKIWALQKTAHESTSSVQVLENTKRKE